MQLKKLRKKNFRKFRIPSKLEINDDFNLWDLENIVNSFLFKISSKLIKQKKFFFQKLRKIYLIPKLTGIYLNRKLVRINCVQVVTKKVIKIVNIRKR